MAVDGGERVLCALRKRAPRREVAGMLQTEGSADRGNFALGLRLTATQSRLPRWAPRLIAGGLAVDGGERVLCAPRKRAPRREVAGMLQTKGSADRGNFALGSRLNEAVDRHARRARFACATETRDVALAGTVT